jgi:peptide deformylase
MATLLQISQLGNPVLKTIASKINKIDKDIVELVENMIATMQDASGVGIAAPQVYRSDRLFIVASKPNQKYPNAPFREPFAVINPEIIEKSEEIVNDWEGCLSVNQMRGLVPRHNKIKVKYLNILGKEIEEELEGFIARIFQHEFDHLEGIMFLDRVASTKDLMSQKEYERMMLEELLARQRIEKDSIK